MPDAQSAALVQEVMENRWRYGSIDGMTLADTTRLVHTGGGAELVVRGDRLLPGPGYDHASAPVRHELELLGSIFQLRTRGIFHVHAAGVVDDQGRAWLLAGESGSGKSTLTYALSRAGWKVLGDDGVTIECTAAGVISHPWAEPIRVSIELSREFAELSELANLVDWTDPRHRVPVTRSVTHATSAPVRALALIAQSSRDSLTIASPTEVLAALIRQSPTVLLNDAHAARQLAALAALVNSVPVFHLEHSPRQLHLIATTLTEAACTLDIGLPPMLSSPLSAMVR